MSSLARQNCKGVEVRHWTVDAFDSYHPPQRLSRPVGYRLPLAEEGLGERGVADLVIEAFACELPETYVAAMAAQEHKPVWINLEYLSAEDWVEGCHKLPSPHPSLHLVKYFFFPGFTPKTGGLLLERDLLVRCDAFQRDPQAIAAYWESLGIPAPQADEARVSLFCYENPALPELLSAWEQSATPICCLVPEGRILPQVKQYFEDAGRDLSRHGGCVGINPDLLNYSCGNLGVYELPFVEQEHYDELLWACDVNFVRGEDSFVRAQWAGQPFVWHIYPQHDDVHLQKLRAFMELYCAGLPPDAARALHGLWEGWNGGGDLPAAWNDLSAHRSILRQHAHAWARELSHNNLALNLLDFFREVDRMRDFVI